VAEGGVGNPVAVHTTWFWVSGLLLWVAHPVLIGVGAGAEGRW